MYELTNILVTMSAASASFVAILGGFIASKLITISGERSVTTEKIAEVEKELQFLEDQNTTLLTEVLENDAVDFIIDHIQALIGGEKLDSIYDDGTPKRITLEDLRPFWEKAVHIYHRFLNIASSGKPPLNDDYIPMDLAHELKEDNFSYTVCKGIADECKRSISSYSIYSPITARITPKWCNDNLDIIKSNRQRIKSLEFTKQQLIDREKALKEPEGIKIGFLIFVLFSAFCIVLPLVFTPFRTDDYCLFLCLKITFISVFVLGLLAIFSYLISLLKFTKKK